jgi:hypothetical protein
MNMSKLYLFGVAFACIISLISTASYAQSPSSEILCDELRDATPSLYGLCVAYWETQGIENPGEPPANAKILERYRAKMKPGDPDMPGLPSGSDCPCWSDDQFSEASDGVYDNVMVDVECNISEFPAGTEFSVTLWEKDNSTNADYSNLFVTRDALGEGPYCSYWTPTGVPVSLVITEEQRQSCHTQLSGRCHQINQP